ncbi:MAG TPA: hypothetical protein VFH51_09470, partial [Myxococcota bacterium]|nr:hypothetical protein [Myxococcota bacterium]
MPVLESGRRSAAVSLGAPSVTGAPHPPSRPQSVDRLEPRSPRRSGTESARTPARPEPSPPLSPADKERQVALAGRLRNLARTLGRNFRMGLEPGKS